MPFSSVMLSVAVRPTLAHPLRLNCHCPVRLAGAGFDSGEQPEIERATITKNVSRKGVVLEVDGGPLL